MVNQKTDINFLPFNAINEFMRNDFRISVIKSAFANQEKLDRKTESELDKLVRKHVKVAGFRNSAKAPIPLKSVRSIKSFEEEPQFTAIILEAWSQSKPELRSRMYQILLDLDWKLLPHEIDRSRLPGFLTHWPEEDDYEVLYNLYSETNPEDVTSIDETSLMAVWLSGRLPVEKVNKKELEIPEFYSITKKLSSKE